MPAVDLTALLEESHEHRLELHSKLIAVDPNDLSPGVLLLLSEYDRQVRFARDVLALIAQQSQAPPA